MISDELSPDFSPRRRSYNLRYRYTFGQLKPSAAMNASPSRPVEVFVPDCPSTQDAESLQNILRSRQTCYANPDADGNEYMDDCPLHDNESKHFLVHYYTPSTIEQERFAEKENDEDLRVSEADDKMDVDEELDDESFKERLEHTIANAIHQCECDASCTSAFQLEPSNESLEAVQTPDCTASQSVLSTIPATNVLPDSPLANNYATVPIVYKLFADCDLPRPPSAPSLKKYMMIVDEIVVQATKANTVIIEKKPFKILQHQLVCFLPRTWLEDDVVDFYLFLLKTRNNINPGFFSKTYIFPSTFYSLLASQKGLQAVEKSADGDNIFEHDLVMFPVCNTDHWRLIVADMQKKTINAYNSMHCKPDLQIVKNIERYLKHEFQRLYPTDELPKWEQRTKLDVPQQDNGYDCGVFMLQFADYLSKGAEFDFGPPHIPYFRAKLLYECTSGRLLQ